MTAMMHSTQAVPQMTLIARLNSSQPPIAHRRMVAIAVAPTIIMRMRPLMNPILSLRKLNIGIPIPLGGSRLRPGESLHPPVRDAAHQFVLVHLRRRPRPARRRGDERLRLRDKIIV